MKRQKRDKLSRAHSKGYQAGITGKLSISDFKYTI
jgi:ribosome modulation factor